jgi:hypothetical protein
MVDTPFLLHSIKYVRKGFKGLQSQKYVFNSALSYIGGKSCFTASCGVWIEREPFMNAYHPKGQLSSVESIKISSCGCIGSETVQPYSVKFASLRSSTKLYHRSIDLETRSSSRGPILIWLIVSQLLALASLFFWLVAAGLSVMAFDSGVTREAWNFVIAVWAYPI